jgi:hypothetical protein
MMLASIKPTEVICPYMILSPAAAIPGPLLRTNRIHGSLNSRICDKMELNWDVLRDLNRLGVSPTIQIRAREQNRAHRAHEAKPLGGDGTLRFSEKFGLFTRRPAFGKR